MIMNIDYGSYFKGFLQTLLAAFVILGMLAMLLLIYK